MRWTTRIPKLRPRAKAAHKGDFGTVLLLCGSEFMLGATILCARGALRGGAGLVRAALPAPLCVPFMTAVPCATTEPRRAPEAVGEHFARTTAAVVGPGLGADALTQRMVTAALGATQVPLVLDADALNVLAPLRSTLHARAPLVLTPHPGEAGRLLGSDAASVQSDRRAAVAELARRSGAVVVLKGAGTLVTDGERGFTNRTGNPGMATGGAGDVLAGLLGALLAQGLEAFEAACLAVHVHGAAGDRVARRLSPVGLCAEDLPQAIAEVWRGGAGK
jgi:hydroxyethylthiazole kinase-like uncharacterized protein yjeF